MDALWAKRPHTLIDASGLEVGLPDRQMGNSEVGHVNLGAGRIVYQDLTRLDVEIKERTFFANPVLTAAVDQPKMPGKRYTSWVCSLLAAFTATKITSWRW
jgi:2,3-bisphosphoglycerate-independent phosphoglycerate mutase